MSAALNNRLRLHSPLHSSAENRVLNEIVDLLVDSANLTSMPPMCRVSVVNDKIVVEPLSNEQIFLPPDDPPAKT